MRLKQQLVSTCARSAACRHRRAVPRRRSSARFRAWRTRPRSCWRCCRRVDSPRPRFLHFGASERRPAAASPRSERRSPCASGGHTGPPQPEHRRRRPASRHHPGMGNMERLERIIGRLPEAERVDIEEWGDHPTFRVNGKNFVFCDRAARHLSLKLPKDEAAAVIATDPHVDPAGYGRDRHAGSRSPSRSPPTRTAGAKSRSGSARPTPWSRHVGWRASSSRKTQRTRTTDDPHVAPGHVARRSLLGRAGRGCLVAGRGVAHASEGGDSIWMSKPKVSALPLGTNTSSLLK